ncbi:MAG: ribosome small subunit-dependent GTPase A [Candidatus Moranbacteria bacterium]|nr:ribosome small subunit-dependent GTPase A [Candidatus Moranbacteria bacterium]
MEKELTIEDLGWDAFFETERVKLGLDAFQIARVIAEHRGAYKVKNTKGEYLAKITGKRIFDAKSREDYPAVGDWVAITDAGERQAIIRSILPRKTIIKRKYGDKNKTGEKNDAQIIATNIDVAFVVESVDRDFNLNRLERYFALAIDGGISPAIILNKTDLVSEEDLSAKLFQMQNRFKDIDFILTSTLHDKGLDELKKYIARGKTYCFLGSSGVGKSTLINQLLGTDGIKTGEIGSRSGRGKHTTTAREMYFLREGPDASAGAGGIVIDNPGMREVGMADMGAGVDSFFDEITALAKDCKYADCTHVHEPGCAVVEAVEAGRLDKGRHANYISLKKETEHYAMTEFEKKEKNRQFGKFLKKAKEELRNAGHKDY